MIPLFRGPPLDEGPLPALFYFALSDDESLNLDPFNQPVKFLEGKRLRIFSLTLPGHSEGLDPKTAVDSWIEQLSQGIDHLTPFFENAVKIIEELSAKNVISKLALAGLSRGAFVAMHIAARCPLVSAILGFAPMVKLAHLDIDVSKLCDRTIRFYIGNRDVRTGSENCFHLVRDLANEAYDRGIRSSPIEMIVGPSIGYKGHGTSPEVFKAGAEWIKEQLL